MEHAVYAGMYRYEKVFWWHRGMQRLSEMLLSTYLPKSLRRNRILDVGCGTGGSFETLLKFGFVVGLDASPEALRYARLRGGTELFLGSIEKMPFSSHAFDAVNCNDVLYHRLIRDDVVALQECARVLKGDGLLFIREPAWNSLRGRHDELVWTKRRYTRGELFRKLEEAGFEVLWGSYVNCFLFPVALLARTIEKILPLSKSDPEVFKPPLFLNAFFIGVLFVETLLLRYTRLPFGLSIVCVAKKRKSG